MLRRRDFLKLALATPLIARAAPRSKKILILGGTSYLGPAVVERAFARGHTVTLFNRGRTNPQLFPSAEKLRGDREQGDLSALEGTRRWDAVVDVWPSDPKLVSAAARLLASRCDFYFFVSTISVYATYERPGIDETAPLRLDRAGYGGDKARAEKAVQEMAGERAAICRPHAIVGPRDEGLAYHYWLQQLAKDGEILAPGDGTDAVELVDVRDVGAWIVDSVERSRTGVYNLFRRPTPFRDFLDESRRRTDGRAKIVWVANQFLEARGVRHFDNLPYWTPDRPGFARISPERAFKEGFSPRPLDRDGGRRVGLVSRTAPAGRGVSGRHAWGSEFGISAEREKVILAARARR